MHGRRQHTVLLFASSMKNPVPLPESSTHPRESSPSSPNRWFGVAASMPMQLSRWAFQRAMSSSILCRWLSQSAGKASRASVLPSPFATALSAPCNSPSLVATGMSKTSFHSGSAQSTLTVVHCRNWKLRVAEVATTSMNGSACFLEENSPKRCITSMSGMLLPLKMLTRQLPFKRDPLGRGLHATEYVMLQCVVPAKRDENVNVSVVSGVSWSGTVTLPMKSFLDIESKSYKVKVISFHSPALPNMCL
mmetsp:Transcript_103181/g.315700  ORF Transcript_103181/g.315700 Transcript_103181/m.315700 type:complete len:249 (+) Transcript_103181:96-842(+)